MKAVGISILSHKNERDRQTKKQNKVFFYKVKKKKKIILKFLLLYIVTLSLKFHGNVMASDVI